jgi:hypothetical protein
MTPIRRHLTYANVMATIAAFIALGGGAYAAFHLPRNSVKSKHIVNGQVKERDLAPAEPVTLVSAPGGPEFESFNDASHGPSEWTDATDALPVGYYRDPYGVVHLQGSLCVIDSGAFGDCAFAFGYHNTPAVFTLPPGYRPGAFEEHFAATGGSDEIKMLRIQSGVLYINPNSSSDSLWLDGISFRCGPSGKHGCP